VEKQTSVSGEREVELVGRVEGRVAPLGSISLSFGRAKQASYICVHSLFIVSWAETEVRKGGGRRWEGKAEAERGATTNEDVAPDTTGGDGSDDVVDRLHTHTVGLLLASVHR
jgi:hypothetical protein